MFEMRPFLTEMGKQLLPADVKTIKFLLKDSFPGKVYFSASSDLSKNVFLLIQILCAKHQLRDEILLMQS